jgi:hypothetical protein
MEDTPTISLNACRRGEEGVAKYKESRRGALERPQFGNTAVMLNVIPKAGMTREAFNCRNYFWRWFFSNVEGKQAQVDFNYLPSGSGEIVIEQGIKE